MRTIRYLVFALLLAGCAPVSAAICLPLDVIDPTVCHPGGGDGIDPGAYFYNPPYLYPQRSAFVMPYGQGGHVIDY